MRKLAPSLTSLGIVALTLWINPIIATAAEVRVATTIKPIHSLVARVMEGVGTPSVLVSGTASPHSYALKPSDAQALNAAQVFFRVSERIEPFTGKIAKSLPASVRVVTLADAPGVKLLDQRQGNTFEADDHGHDGDAHDHDKHAKADDKDDADHDHDKADKKDAAHHDDDDHDKDGHEKHDDDDDHDKITRDHHIWLDPENAKAMVAEIVRVLSDVSPADAARFRANADKLTAEIDAMTLELATALKPLAGKPFVVFHDAYQYFERRFDLAVVGSITMSPDVQPSAKRLTAIRKKIKELGAVCVFAEPMFKPNLVAAVTEDTTARSGTLDPEGTALTPGPNAYFELMRGLSTSLQTCLGAQS